VKGKKKKVGVLTEEEWFRGGDPLHSDKGKPRALKGIKFSSKVVRIKANKNYCSRGEGGTNSGRGRREKWSYREYLER